MKKILLFVGALTVGCGSEQEDFGAGLSAKGETTFTTGGANPTTQLTGGWATISMVPGQIHVLELSGFVGNPHLLRYWIQPEDQTASVVDVSDPTIVFYQSEINYGSKSKPATEGWFNVLCEEAPFLLPTTRVGAFTLRASTTVNVRVRVEQAYCAAPEDESQRQMCADYDAIGQDFRKQLQNGSCEGIATTTHQVVDLTPQRL